MLNQSASPSPRLADAVPASCDVLVVGGGINGAGIARDLAGRGYSVVLCEKDDLAAHTSSSSTKLIHGGLRYLEYYEFGLVRKALLEREVLLRSAPHIMWPLRFVMPLDPANRAGRPAWLIRLGIFLYDHLARREILDASRGVRLRKSPLGEPLQPQFTQGFVYSDGWVDDARLVVLNAIDAMNHGAVILTRTRCTRAQRHADHWQVDLQAQGGAAASVRAKALVNAAGPWAESFLREQARPAGAETLAQRHLRLVKGSHIVVPRLFAHDHAYIFQNADRRIIFAIPYERDFTLIGTTDVEVGRAESPTISGDEVAYLCEQASRYFARPVRAQDVVWTFAGVRPLLDDDSGDPAAVTRDYLLERHVEAAPLLSVWGGKITTYRRLAEDAADALGQMLQVSRKPWTEGRCLPGGDLSSWVRVSRHPVRDFRRFVEAVQARHAWLPAALTQRWARAYGTRIDDLLRGASSASVLGQQIAPDLFEIEIDYLRRAEWARDPEDVLWRRSKLGLHYTPAQRQAVHDWWRQHPARHAQEASAT